MRWREREVLSLVKYERPALADSPWLFSIALTPSDWNDPWLLCVDLWYKCWGRDVEDPSPPRSPISLLLPGGGGTAHGEICYVFSLVSPFPSSSASCSSLCLFQFDKWVASGTSDSIFKLTICNQFSKEGRGRGTRWKTWGRKMEMKPCLFWQRGTKWKSSSSDYLKGQFTQKSHNLHTLMTFYLLWNIK